MPEFPLGSDQGSSGCPLARAYKAEASTEADEWAAVRGSIEVPPGLSSKRDTSSIPSGKGHWNYPSERQFYMVGRSENWVGLASDKVNCNRATEAKLSLLVPGATVSGREM